MSETKIIGSAIPTPRTDELNAKHGNMVNEPRDWIVAYSELSELSKQLERELTNEVAAGRWRPIASAPRDGRYVLLAGPSGHMSTPLRVHVGRWEPNEHDRLHPERESGWRTHSHEWFECDGDVPTHWLPLPGGAE